MNTTDPRLTIFQTSLDNQASKNKFKSILLDKYDPSVNNFNVTGIESTNITVQLVSGSTYEPVSGSTTDYVYVSSDGNKLTNSQITSLNNSFQVEFEQSGFNQGEVLVFLPY